jgi:hypothetical protein
VAQDGWPRLSGQFALITVAKTQRTFSGWPVTVISDPRPPGPTGNSQLDHVENWPLLLLLRAQRCCAPRATTTLGYSSIGKLEDGLLLKRCSAAPSVRLLRYCWRWWQWRR